MVVKYSFVHTITEFNFIRKITLTEVAVIYQSKVFIFHLQANNLTNVFDFDDSG